MRAHYDNFFLIDGDVYDPRRGHLPPQPVDDAAERQLNRLLAAKRRGKAPLDMFYGHMFWAISHDSAKLVTATYETDEWLVESCRHSAFTDEYFFQSIIGAAKYPQGAVDSPVYADFFRHAPRVVWNARDLPFDMPPHFLFLRKIGPEFDPGLPEACARLYGGLRRLLADPGVQGERAVLLGEGETRHIHLFAPAGDHPDWREVSPLWGRRGRRVRAEVCVWRFQAPLSWRNVNLTLACMSGAADGLPADAALEINGRRAPLVASDLGYSAEFRDLAQPFDAVRLHMPGQEERGPLVSVMPQA